MNRTDEQTLPSTTYGFEVDPCVVLGIANRATIQEIREAYRAKASKHHPDHGGDEWAFRIVVRSYEILTTARVAGHVAQDATEPAPAATRPAPFRTPPRANAQAQTEWYRPGRRDAWAPPGKLVDVELFLLRFEIADVMDLFTGRDKDRNLSCSLNISWSIPPDAVSPDDAAETLQDLVRTFEAMPSKTKAITSWSRVEGMRFIGWLSYPNANRTWEAFEMFQSALNKRKIGVNQSTREMILPRNIG